MDFKTEHIEQSFSSRSLLEEYSLLFYIGKYLGISSQDYQEFRKNKRLIRSPGGDCYVIILMIIIFVNFNLMVGVFDNSVFVEEKNLLSVVIGYVLTYFSLVSYLVDRITALRKQNDFIEIFDSLQDIQDDFEELGLVVNNSYIRCRIACALLYSFLLEAIIFLSTFITLVDRSSWTAWLWAFTAVPTFSNSLDKIWYLSVVVVIQNRFDIINREIQRMTENLKNQNKKPYEPKTKLKVPKLKPSSGSKAKVFPQKIQPINGFPTNSEITKLQTAASIESALSNLETKIPVASELLEERFSRLCQLHDGLCEVARQLNELWSIPNLVIMGYCFFIITAQLYFLYCSNVNQAIPTLFRPASSMAITAINLMYVASKCIRILYVNWRTNLVAKKTGICLHRYALAADKNEIYEMINHLSLKIFNHAVEFNACGFFSLDMATLFAFCGGITTYLIILIQFNIEEQQVKSNGNGNTPQILVDYDSPSKMTPRNMSTLFHLIYYNYMNGGPWKDN